jgi:hypothetical protein
MSREQLEMRLQELVQQNQIVINGEVEVVDDDEVEDDEETNLLQVSDSSEQ